MVELIKYKAQLEGIKVVEINEAYTSGVSAVDLEPIMKKFYDKTKRVFRGLFRSKDMSINADVNGSLNILRKLLGKKCIPKLITSARDKGFVDSPVVIRLPV